MNHHNNADDAVFTCPMHPDVRQNGLGDCPECGMHLVPEIDVGEHVSHGHQTHIPDSHSADKGTDYDTVPEGFSGAVCTCPMHAEVRQTHPGSCPICGMGLELENAAMAADGPNPELVDFTHRFWVGAVLTFPLLILTMGPFIGFPGVRDIFGERPTLWIELALGTTVVWWCGVASCQSCCLR